PLAERDNSVFIHCKEHNRCLGDDCPQPLFGFSERGSEFRTRVQNGSLYRPRRGCRILPGCASLAQYPPNCALLVTDVTPGTGPTPTFSGPSPDINVVFPTSNYLNVDDGI
ncbi:MAG TPA: hypothetical protein VIL63_09685, partial [Terriglobales bacterium]